MCVIIDANVLAELQTPSADAQPIVNAIERRQMRLVVGGKNTTELSKSPAVSRWIAGLVRANLAHAVPRADIEREELALSTLGKRKSNDLHVIALARASGARLLFSRDKNLAQDFKNRTFVDKPTGSVYKQRQHAHLLKSVACRN